MTGWAEVLKEFNSYPVAADGIRRRYLKELHDITERNVITYYSGWLSPKGSIPGVPFHIHDGDQNGFMACIHGLDRTKGLDLILHTPGGDVAATESIIKYLVSMFSSIRVIVPQLAMSGGTMIALCADEIVMGKHSSLGPIDPQINGSPAGGFIEEFERAIAECKADPARIPIWQPIIAKYPPAFIGQCERATKWANEIATEALKDRMFGGEPDAGDRAQTVVETLGSHAASLAHSRHYSIDQVRCLGLNVTPLEDAQDLQDAVLSIHHATLITFDTTGAFKIIENHTGACSIGQVTVTPQPMNSYVPQPQPGDSEAG